MTDVQGLNHLALVVEDLDQAIQFWCDTLGLTLEKVEDIPEEGARVAFLPLGASRVELVQPTQTESGLSRFLQKRGPGFHHLCLEVADIQTTLQQMDEKGIELINPEPVTGSDGRQYAFLHPKSVGGVLIELYQLP